MGELGVECGWCQLKTPYARQIKSWCTRSCKGTAKVDLCNEIFLSFNSQCAPALGVPKANIAMFLERVTNGYCYALLSDIFDNSEVEDGENPVIIYCKAFCPRVVEDMSILRKLIQSEEYKFPDAQPELQRLVSAIDSSIDQIHHNRVVTVSQGCKLCKKTDMNTMFRCEVLQMLNKAMSAPTKINQNSCVVCTYITENLPRIKFCSAELADFNEPCNPCRAQSPDAHGTFQNHTGIAQFTNALGMEATGVTVCDTSKPCTAAHQHKFETQEPKRATGVASAPFKDAGTTFGAVRFLQGIVLLQAMRSFEDSINDKLKDTMKKFAENRSCCGCFPLEYD